MHLLKPYAFKRCIFIFYKSTVNRLLDIKSRPDTIYRNGFSHMLSASESLIKVCKDILDAFGTD